MCGFRAPSYFFSFSSLLTRKCICARWARLSNHFDFATRPFDFHPPPLFPSVQTFGILQRKLLRASAWNLLPLERPFAPPYSPAIRHFMWDLLFLGAIYVRGAHFPNFFSPPFISSPLHPPVSPCVSAPRNAIVSPLRQRVSPPLRPLYVLRADNYARS